MPPELTRLVEALQGLPPWFQRLEAAHASLLLLAAAWAVLRPARPSAPGWVSVLLCALAALAYWHFWSLPLVICLALLAAVAARAASSGKLATVRCCVVLAGLCMIASSLAPLLVGGA